MAGKPIVIRLSRARPRHCETPAIRGVERRLRVRPVCHGAPFWSGTMAKTHRSYFFLSAAGGLLFGLGVSCAQKTAANDGELAELEASLAATTSSLASTDQAVQECFTAFRSCIGEAADGAARTSCGTDLAACLPEQPLAPPECALDAGAAGAGFAGRPGAPRGERGFGRGPQRFHGGAPGDADAGFGGVEAGGRCAPPLFPRGGFRGCAGRAADNLAGGAEPGSVASSCRACVREAFEDRRAALCAKAAELCAADDAPQRICARVTQACDGVAQATPDAGAP
jgi:hypothetical protein